MIHTFRSLVHSFLHLFVIVGTRVRIASPQTSSFSFLEVEAPEVLERDAHGRRRLRDHRGLYNGLPIPHGFSVRLEVSKGDGDLVPLFVGIRKGLPAARVFVPHQKASPPDLDHRIDDLLGNGGFLGLCRCFVEGTFRFDEGSKGDVARVIHNLFALPEDNVTRTGALDHVVVVVLVVHSCRC